MSSYDSSQLPALIAKRFIQRRDVFAVQTDSGGYMPVHEGDIHSPLVPLRGRNVVEHLEGKRTYGHYLLDANNECRVFAFDIDLEERKVHPESGAVTGRGFYVPTLPDPWAALSDSEWLQQNQPVEFNARESWRDRAHPARPWLKYQMRMLSAMLARAISTELEIPTAVTYTGAKGVHVYGFTGPMQASDAREGAQVVLDSLGCFVPKKGQHFFKHANEHPVDGYPNFSVEVFPKQVTIGDGGFGNLMRLPLGRNRKNPKDPTFFVDMRRPFTELAPHPDPVALLESGNPWAD